MYKINKTTNNSEKLDQNYLKNIKLENETIFKSGLKKHPLALVCNECQF